MSSFPIREIVYPAVVCAIFFAAYSAERGGVERKLAIAWMWLFGLSGAFRILLELLPATAPALTSVLVGAALVFLCRRALRRGVALPAPTDAYWIALLAFLAIRSFFPQFDVDSLLYHLAGIRYLHVRSILPPYQQSQEVASLWYDWLGPEESLLAPLAALDLGLGGGLLGGVFKALSTFTVISLIPARAFFLRALAAWLLLIDDHFFFSGQSRFVYLNPMLIGLLSAGLWCTLRAWRSPAAYALPAALFSLMAAAVKLHGMFFLAASIAVTAVAFSIRKVNPATVLARPANRAMVTLAVFGTTGFFFLKWVSLGSPLAPFNFMFWKSDHQWRGIEYLIGLQGKGSVAAVLRAPWSALIYPGNLAMKAVVVIIGPALLLPAFRKERRWSALAASLLLSTIAWGLLAHILNPTESRYPRYGFGIAVLALSFFAIAVDRFLRNRAVQLPGRLRKFSGHILAVLLVLHLALSIDTRYFNVPTSERPKWAHIINFLGSLGSYPSLSPSAPHMQGLFLEFMYTDVARLEECWRRVDFPEALRDGAGLVAFPFESPWPLILLGAGGVYGTMVEGGGTLRKVDGIDQLRARGVTHALVPKDPVSRLVVKNHADQEVRLKFSGDPVCESQNMILLKLR